jgi:AraC-like DNA-binding protein
MDTDLFNRRMQMAVSSMEPFQVGPLKVRVTNFHDSRLGPFTTQLHEHFFYEFCRMKESSCTYQIHEQTVSLRAGDSSCILVPSAQHHLRKSSGPCVSVMAHLIIEPAAPKQVFSLQMFRETIYHRRFLFRCSAQFRSLEEELRAIVRERKSCWMEFASCKLKELMLSLFSENFPDLAIPEYASCIRKNQEIIGRLLYMISVWSNFSVTSGFIAEKVGLSERHLSRIVKEEFGMALGEFITRKRMEYAKELLSGNIRLVKDAAVSLGYRDTGHFCRVFRKVFGITPKQYVRQRQIAARDPEETLQN